MTTQTSIPSQSHGLSLQVNDLHVSFENNKVLEGVNFELKEKEHLAILGPGGCGKSTLLKTIVGLIAPQSGTIEIFGQDILKLSRDDKRAVLRQVSMAFQLGALFDFMTVRENIMFAMENLTERSYLEMEKITRDYLGKVNLPKAAHKLPSELSGGMRRRVGIVRALATEPRLALLDEPTAGLDPVTTTVVIDMIHKLSSETESSLLCVTSSVEVAFTFSKRVAILKEGKIIGIGTWDELHAMNDSWITNFLDVREFVPAQNN